MDEVDCKNAKITNYDDVTREITLQLNQFAYNAFLLIKHKFKNLFCRCRLTPPKKPRTTGEKSQNHAINGFCQQIAIANGQDFDTVKLTAKYRAISRGWKYLEINVRDPKTGMMLNYVYPESEADADTIQAGYLIDELKQIAAENNIILKEE